MPRGQLFRMLQKAMDTSIRNITIQSLQIMGTTHEVNMEVQLLNTHATIAKNNLGKII